MLSFLSSLSVVEGTLSLASSLLGELSRRFGICTPRDYGRILAIGIAAAAPLLGCCSSTYMGLCATSIFISAPYSALVIGLSRLSKLGWPSKVLPITSREATTIIMASSICAALIGPREEFKLNGSAFHALLLLTVLRLVKFILCAGLIMPSQLVSCEPGQHSMDRRIAALGDGESCDMVHMGTAFRVTRQRLGHVDAIAVEHPAAPHKWVLSLHGNGEYLEGGFVSKLTLALQMGCSVIACDYRGVGRSRGLLRSASAMVDDAACCVRYCEGRLAAGADPSRSILIIGQSMGGGVAVELAGRYFPHLPCVNMRSFAALPDVSCIVLGLYDSPHARRIIRFGLSLIFNMPIWRTPLNTIRHWATLRAGNKMLIYHDDDQVIGRAGLVYELERTGRLEGTKVVQLRGRPRDAHNEPPSSFSRDEWAEAVAWMRERLELL